jgi:hypothetical protein
MLNLFFFKFIKAVVSGIKVAKSILLKFWYILKVVEQCLNVNLDSNPQKIMHCRVGPVEWRESNVTTCGVRYSLVVVG